MDRMRRMQQAMERPLPGTSGPVNGPEAPDIDAPQDRG
jgi:hypothetical protein